MALHSFLRAVALFSAAAAASVPTTKSLNSSLTILIDNDLQGPNSSSADSGVILLSPRSRSDAVAGCQELGEQLWSEGLDTASIQPNLDYLVYQGQASNDTQFWVASKGNGTSAFNVAGQVSSVDSDSLLPALCTQSAPFSNSTYANTSSEWQVTVHSNNEDLVGFRDRVSFRFLGVRYAPQPRRFTYSVPYNGSNGTVNATAYGSACVQGSSGAEDCLFLNVWTPHLPKSGSEERKSNLKPVMFWIHGGAYMTGSGSDTLFDGGNMASRGDAVVVAMNYRLSTLGFLALDDGVTNGNFGLADQITALDFVRAHIKDFGGDPDRITIFGQSAGAASVRAIMASPKAVGKFAAALPLSNLGGLNYGTTYSEYYTIDEEVDVAANAILSATNCTNATSQVSCLRGVPARTLSNLSTIARFVVVDGTYITSDELPLNGTEAPYKLMMGTMSEDGAAFIAYPKTTNESGYLASVGFAVPPSSLFPIPHSGNATRDLFNMSSRLATDGMFRCADQATVFTGLENDVFGEVYYYEFGRSYQTVGYPQLDVCQPPKTASHPFGDPSLPYLRCHSGELYLVFGNLAREGVPLRDEYDLPFEQFTLDSFASFARTHDPNPDKGFLAARGFANTTAQMDMAGTWKPATKGNLTTRVLDWPSHQAEFREVQQCEAIGVPLTTYYE